MNLKVSPTIDANYFQSHPESRLKEWAELTDAGLRLRLGELTAQEIRTVRAVLAAIQTKI
jgi:hypothetical protein